MRIWPLVAVLSLVAFVAVFIGSAGDEIHRLGNITGWSLGVFFSSLVFGGASLMSAWASWKLPVEGVRRSVRIYTIVVTKALLVATAYFAYWGIIGLRTWK